ncbi:hypothetical protein P3X46_026894 [Hevea brasiliensis]|uniref:Minichromosome loss protein Mcl1 middle region domain-containing protein n=1 Tax=Hevea brasiliensis TaxID=3981 RepID=A0ABQ9L1K9_HEVBR|nr:hypothetical protein P3X46_026894 [Hevea brasiliensis]
MKLSSPDGPITAYDTVSGTTLARFTGSHSPCHRLALAGKAYVAASHISSSTASASIHLYNWLSPTALHRLPIPQPVGPLAVTPDGLYLFAGNIIKSFLAHYKPASSLRINSDWSLVISGGDDGTIVVVPIFQLEEASGKEDASDLSLHRFVAHNGPVTSIIACLGLCRPTIASCSTDCTGKFILISRIALDPTEVEFYAAGSDGLMYKGFLKISAAEDGIVYIWEIEKGQMIMVLGSNMEGISDVEWWQRDWGLAGVWNFSGKKLSAIRIKDTVDVEDVLTGAASNRRKATDMLESAIGVNERRLELILKEANGVPPKMLKMRKLT